MTMTRVDRLQAARDALVAGHWSDACSRFQALDAEQPLGSPDLERLAEAHYLVGREPDSVDTWTRAFHDAREQHDLARAARCGFWVGFVLLNRGDLPGGNGWIARVQRVLDGGDTGAAEIGYLRYLVGLHTIFTGDTDAALAAFQEAARVGTHCTDRDLETLARLGQGRAFIRLGRLEKGVACLDEAIVAVATGEVSPIVVGDGYCTAIEGCQELFDLRRAQRWTEDLRRWCQAHPDLVAFRGQCLLHHAEVLQQRGAWPDAMSEVDRALAHHARPASQLAAGAAHYQQGELHRLRGNVEQAEAAFEQARRRGRQPQPGLALLRLATGQVAHAVAAIRRALAEADDRTTRSGLLPAAVEVLVAAGDLEEAMEAFQELEATATGYHSQVLDAATAQSRGMIRLAQGEPGTALPPLRLALETWHALDAPYQAARTHVLIGQASHALGDEEGARAEWEAARETLTALGARPDLARLDGLQRGHTHRDTHGLSERQLEVLRHVASGRTNRQIAEALVISHRTVERHVSDIFTRLRVSSRAAATAYAYEHDLL